MSEHSIHLQCNTYSLNLIYSKVAHSIEIDYVKGLINSTSHVDKFSAHSVMIAAWATFSCMSSASTPAAGPTRSRRTSCTIWGVHGCQKGTLERPQRRTKVAEQSPEVPITEALLTQTFKIPVLETRMILAPSFGLLFSRIQNPNLKHHNRNPSRLIYRCEFSWEDASSIN